MTFVERLESLTFDQLHPDLTFVGIGTSFILFHQDEEYLRYDLSTHSLVSLTEIKPAGVCYVCGKYLIVEDNDFNTGLSILIYDLIEDELLQHYENVTSTLRETGFISHHSFARKLVTLAV